MKTIAVIEDNPDNRLLVRVILEQLYEVVEYENGFAALEDLPKRKPDLVLLDISLPRMDGTEVLNQIRSNEQLRDLPVIALTAHAMAGDREKYLALGFDDYVAKPIVDETLLLDAIRRKLPEDKPGSTTAINQSNEPDPAALERLRRLGGEPFVGRMVDLFLQYAAQKIREARAAHAAGNLAGVEDAMHPVRSSAGNVGARRIQELATTIEQLAKQRRAESLDKLLGELERAFAAAVPGLQAARQTPAHQPPAKESQPDKTGGSSSEKGSH